MLFSGCCGVIVVPVKQRIPYGHWLHSFFGSKFYLPAGVQIFSQPFTALITHAPGRCKRHVRIATKCKPYRRGFPATKTIVKTKLIPPTMLTRTDNPRPSAIVFCLSCRFPTRLFNSLSLSLFSIAIKSPQEICNTHPSRSPICNTHCNTQNREKLEG